MSTSELEENIVSEQIPIIEITENGIEGFEILCRLCANRSDHLIPIYSEEGISNDLSNKMNLYLPVKVSEADTLPLQCCYQCASTVLTWHELVIASVEADRRLRQLQIEAEKHLEEQNAAMHQDILEEHAEIKSDSEDDRLAQVINVNTFHGVSVYNLYEDEIFLCEMCPQLFKKRKDFNIHLLLHKEKKKPSHCMIQYEEHNICEKEIENIDNSSIIVPVGEEYNTNKKLVCEICNNSFLTEDSLYAHTNTKHNELVLKKDENVLIKEIYIKDKKSRKGLQCEICCKSFSRISNLNAHQITHTKDFYCYVCCNSYKSQFKLNHHMTEHTEEELITKKYDPSLVHCPFNCIATFNSKYQLYEHKKQHSNIKDYACNLCDKKFLYMRQLNSHKKKHDENNDCDICGKHFSCSKTLKEHLRLHTGDKPFECIVCKDKFRCQSYLKNHMLIHTGKRNYKCGQCSRTFSRSNYLKEHMRIHFNEKPFKCKLCNQSFVQSNVLKNHLVKKHRQCLICKKHIGNIVQLRMHIWKYHSTKSKCFENQHLLSEETIV